MDDKLKLNRDTYNRIAEDWDKDHTSDSWWVTGVEAFVAMLPSGASVLDVGCGSGKKVKYLSEKGFAATGTDLSERMIEIAKRDMPDKQFFVADMHDLSGIPGRYDALFLQASLLHIPKNEVDAVMEALKKKLKPGGLLYVAVKGRREDEPEEAVVTEDDYGYAYERFFSYFRIPELKEIFARHGFEPVCEHVESMGRRDWLQVVGRKV